VPADHLIGSKVYSENGDIGIIVSVDDGPNPRLYRLLRFFTLPKVRIVPFHCELVQRTISFATFKSILRDDVDLLQEKIGATHYARTKKALKDSQTMEELFNNLEKFMLYW